MTHNPKTSDFDGNPHKVGDKVLHKKVKGTVINVGSNVGINRVLVMRDFNGSQYWDDADYWQAISKQEQI